MSFEERGEVLVWKKSIIIVNMKTLAKLNKGKRIFPRKAKFSMKRMRMWRIEGNVAVQEKKAITRTMIRILGDQATNPTRRTHSLTLTILTISW